MKAIYFTWIIFLKIAIAREEWIDPHDMKIRYTSTYKKSNGNYKEDYRDEEQCDSYNNQNSSYLRKVINLILNMAKFDRHNEIYKGQIIINLNGSSLRQLDVVLDNSFKEISRHSYFHYRYIALKEEAEVDKFLIYKENVKCDPNNLGWFDWLYDKITGYCQRNERSFLLSQRSTILIITPMRVVSEQFEILVPILKYLGQGCGSFMMALINAMPIYMLPYAVIVALVLVMILVLMMGTYVFGICPKFNIFYIFQLEFSKKEHCAISSGREQDSLSGENLRSLLDANLNNSSKQTSIASSQSTKCITYKTKKPKKVTRRQSIKIPKAQPGEIKNSTDSQELIQLELPRQSNQR
ncbi:hypothetical protein HHI36_009296 [Cryptolaemus montrouzieri]|uniref:Chloride channel CLIC-like protein 1 n=1 Tax=Cryptolaemus montrouzieri TaxID=559131 RepID=A0ABD2MUU6_9CUCU